MQDIKLRKLKTAEKDRSTEPVKVFAALSDENRYRIFRLLSSREKICVTELSTIVGVTAACASQHLRILELAGLITRKRDGRRICYETNRGIPIVESLIKFL